MIKLKIGELLLKKGLITEKQLNEVLAIQKKEGGRLGEIFIDKSIPEFKWKVER